jgi:hypothetical protein
MDDDPGVLGSLPRTRPHRRSPKRPPVARADRGADAKRRAPGAEAKRHAPRAPEKPGTGLLDNPVGIAVQAAAELAEIGLSASARALRGVLARLPRP